MSILKIARMGHPVLSQPAEPVADPTAPEIARLVRDMTETMYDTGGVGLAAPQVHVGRRVVVFHVPDDRTSDHPDDTGAGLTVLINPVIESVGDDMETAWEACLSVPGLMGQVPRHRRIRYRGLGVDGDVIKRDAAGFHARVLQHECDHLDGILYPMRMRDLSSLGFVEEMARRAEDEHEAEAMRREAAEA